MSLPKSEQFPDDPDHLPPARKRRARRLLAPVDATERGAFIGEVAHRSSPSIDFYLFSLGAGIVLSIGMLLNEPVILVLGVLLAPMMAPAVGIALGTVIGSIRFFMRSLISLLLAGILVFAMGALAGLLTQYWTPPDLEQAYLHAQLNWADFLVLAVGAGFSAASMLSVKHKPEVPSIALAYELYLPLVVAGFGFTSGFPYLWPDGLVVFAIHLAWSALIGALTLAILGFRPLTLFGYSLGGALTILGIILLIGLGGAGAAWRGQMGIPTPLPTSTPTITPSLTPTLTQRPPTLTPTSTATPTPTTTATITPTPPTPSPTPMYAIIQTLQGIGAVVRDDPGGIVLRSYFDGTLLEVLPGSTIYEGNIWVRVRTPDGLIGWILQDLLVTATPAPNW